MIKKQRANRMTRRHDGTSRGTDKPGGGDGRRYDMNGRGAERNGEPGRQAGRLMMNDELMRTVREKANCHLPGIYSCPRASSGSSRLSSRFLVSSFISSFCLPAARLACLLAYFARHSRRLIRLPRLSSRPSSCFSRLVCRLVVPRCLPIRPAPVVLVRPCGIRYRVGRPASMPPPPDGNRGDETMRG